MERDPIEIISDPCFSTLGTSASPWRLQTHHGVGMTPTVENSALRLDVSKASGANWHGELRYSPFSVEAGEAFTVFFSARATHPFTFSVWLGQEAAPFKSLVADKNHFGEELMMPDWKSFTHTWKAIHSEKAARLNFVLGQRDNSIELRDISLKKQVEQI